MTKHTILFVVATLSTMPTLTLAGAQNPVAPHNAVRIQVVTSSQTTGKVLSTQFHRLSLTVGAAAKFNFELKSTQPVFPPECGFQFRSDDRRSGQRVGSALDGTITPTADGKFQVRLTTTVRDVAGCRLVGQLNIPVFSNRIIQTDALLGIGDTFPLTVDASNDEKLNVALTLTAPE
jgi:hypothetical protein